MYLPGHRNAWDMVLAVGSHGKNNSSLFQGSQQKHYFDLLHSLGVCKDYHQCYTVYKERNTDTAFMADNAAFACDPAGNTHHRTLL